MKQYSIEELQAKFKSLGYEWLPFHLIGVRNKEDNSDQFDDLFYLVNGTSLKVFTGTTNPGVYYLQNFINKAFNATAIMAPQQVFDGFVSGMIFGRKGWRQAKPLKIFRDGNKDLKSDEIGIPEWSGVGLCLHIHAMFAEKAVASWKVWNWSAACQGMNQKSQWEEFMTDCDKAKVSRLTYSLLHEF